MKSLDERTGAFLIRIWEERRDLPEAPRVWRGSIFNVQTGDLTYFTSLREVCGYLEDETGMAGAAAPDVHSTIHPANLPPSPGSPRRVDGPAGDRPTDEDRS